MVTVTFVENNGTVRAVTAEPGISLMQVAVDNMMPGIAADCGGNLSCATCHCYIDDAWVDKVSEASEDERLMLEGVIDPRPNSRLACQIKLHPALDGLQVLLPEG